MSFPTPSGAGCVDEREDGSGNRPGSSRLQAENRVELVKDKRWYVGMHHCHEEAIYEHAAWHGAPDAMSDNPNETRLRRLLRLSCANMCLRLV